MSGHKDYKTFPPLDVGEDIDVGGGGGCSICLSIVSVLFVIFLFPFSLFVSIKVKSITSVVVHIMFVCNKVHNVAAILLLVL